MLKQYHGQGTLFQHKNGRWQGALQVDGKRRTVCVIYTPAFCCTREFRSQR